MPPSSPRAGQVDVARAGRILRDFHSQRRALSAGARRFEFHLDRATRIGQQCPIAGPPIIVKSAAFGPLVLLLAEIGNGDLLISVSVSVFDDACETLP